jgi:hypothetical protein
MRLWRRQCCSERYGVGGWTIEIEIEIGIEKKCHFNGKNDFDPDSDFDLDKIHKAGGWTTFFFILYFGFFLVYPD